MNQENKSKTKNCPFCAEEIQFDAVKCKNCGEWLSNDESWFKKGNELFNLKKYNEAIECCDIVIKLNPDDDGVWMNKSGALYELKKYGEAMECFKIVSKLTEDDELVKLCNDSVVVCHKKIKEEKEKSVFGRISKLFK